MDYIRWLACFVWTPLALLWLINARYVWRLRRTLAFCVGGALVFSVPWDFVAIKARAWHYYAGHIVGLWIGGLPIEEYLYIVSVTLLLATIALLLRRRWPAKEQDDAR